MTSFESVVSRRGQITIPAELRRRLNFREGDRVVITVGEVDDASIVIRPSLPVYERTYGIAARRDEPIDLDEARRMFAESHSRADSQSDAG